MGFLSDGLSVGPGGFSRPSQHSRRHSSRTVHKEKKRRSRSRSRSSSRRRRSAASGNPLTGSLLSGLGSLGSFVTGGEGGGHSHGHHYQKHNTSRGSFFGLGNNSSRSSFFGGRSSSYYKRSPRQGFVQRAYRQLKRLLRDLVHYAKRHPWKVFLLVIMPLVTGGALTALLARFGLRMPLALERMLGVASRAAAGDSIGLVTDAVRMAGDFGSGAPRAPRPRAGDMHWERRSVYSQTRRDNDGWGEGIRGVAKMFL
ncbi:hypothetical protein HIM_04057 [Hirsutella minnesotensis 3608]|uniref:Uncharacterized protein n=1 Tax=Hirsutella minnesotensis 3608 TaxID=1043627 RepID=A0A0F7ZLV9_9HYPO|nr:hypothetical protein HIM_04057 [Hirsutella minnesotensis 3608]